MSTKLQNSFGAVYTLLERPRVARRVVAGLLVIHTFVLGYSAYVHSPTLNEPAHLVAGLSHWKFGRFDLYRVNPPLVRMVAALPVMAVGYNEDWSGFYEGPGARPEMGMGENFVAANGERTFFLFMIARWACIPFSWLGAVICYLWARDLFGRPSGVLACTVWCWEPNILAHASLITPDAHATALGVAACYTFWRWLKQPVWSQAILSGAIFGLAELAKTTLILFYPLWPLMWFVYRKINCTRMVPRDWIREASMLALRMAIGIYVLILGYGFEGSLTPLKDFHFVSDLFTGKEPGNLQSTNRFAESLLGRFPVPAPKDYVLGIDLQQKDFEHYGRPSYLRGVWQDHGWWYFYLYACAIKVPLGLWGLGFLAVLALGCCFSFPRLHIRYGDLFVLLFPPLVVFTVVSMKTGFSEHMRYVLPTFPFLYITVSQVVAIFRKSDGGGLNILPEGVYCGASKSNWGLHYTPLFSISLVSIATSWMLTSSLWVYPHCLSYFNELIGGPRNGTYQLSSSNIDWEQDWRYVGWWCQSHPEFSPVYLIGPCDPGGKLLLPSKSAAPRQAFYAIKSVCTRSRAVPATPTIDGPISLFPTASFDLLYSKQLLLFDD